MKFSDAAMLLTLVGLHSVLYSWSFVGVVGDCSAHAARTRRGLVFKHGVCGTRQFLPGALLINGTEILLGALGSGLRCRPEE
jgi:hypothetical protein